MNHRRFTLRTLALLRLLPGVLILTISVPMVAQAERLAADIHIVKTAHPTVIYAGNSVTYTYRVTNPGDEPLSAVGVTDDHCSSVTGPTEISGNGDSLLHPDEIWEYTCSTTLSQDTTNRATATGTGTLGPVSRAATAFVNVIRPQVQVDKTAQPTTAVTGEPVVYTYRVTNPGDDPLSAVGVTDDRCAPVGGPTEISGNGDSLLHPGEIWEYTCSTALSDDTTNTATVTGSDTLGGTVSDTATAFVSVIHPGIEIAKTPDTQTVASGSDVTFTIAVTNTGDMPLANVTVSDAQASDCEQTFAQLPSGQHRSYSCVAADVRAGFINSAVVVGTIQPLGGEVTAADAAKVRLDETLTCPADMLAYWKLDEDDGATSYADYYYGHNAECGTQCPDAAVGQVGGGQAFNGSNTGIDVPAIPGDDSFEWGVNDSFSIEFWMQTDSDSTCSGNEVVIGRANSAAWWVGCREGGRAAFYLEDNGGTTALVEGTDVTDGAWHHVVAVRNAGAHEILIYVDGNLEASESVTYGSGFESPTTTVNIGWLNRGVQHYHFEGLLDEVAVYNRALSTGQIQEHHGRGRAGRGYCDTGPYPPTIVSTPVTEATVGHLYSYDVEAAGDPAPAYALLAYPDGMSIDPVTGLISWQPVLGQEGYHSVVVQAANSEGTDTQNFTVEAGVGTICPADMIAYWRLDETSGAIYDDLYYNGHDGVCAAGQCPTPVAGVVNGGQRFDGADGVDVLAHTDFSWGASDSFSIEFWMQVEDDCTESEIAIGQTNASAWWVGCQAGGAAAFYLRDTIGEAALVTGAVVTDGAWHHIVAVRDDSADEIRIYVDGQAGSPTAVNYAGGLGSPTDELNIGWLDVPRRYYFKGTLDEMALYSRALSAGEIEQHYSEGEPEVGYCITPDIAVEKSASHGTINAGETVTYTYMLTNPGDDPLSDVGIFDDRCNPVEYVSGDEHDIDKLDPDEVWTFMCRATLTADTTNTATATGLDSMGGTHSATDTAFVEVEDYRVFLPLAMR
jgi:hypothetical protein